MPADPVLLFVAPFALVLTRAGWRPAQAPVIALAPALPPPAVLADPRSKPLDRLTVAQLQTRTRARARARAQPQTRARAAGLPRLAGSGWGCPNVYSAVKAKGSARDMESRDKTHVSQVDNKPSIGFVLVCARAL